LIKSNDDEEVEIKSEKEESFEKVENEKELLI